MRPNFLPACPPIVTCAQSGNGMMARKNLNPTALL